MKKIVIALIMYIVFSSFMIGCNEKAEETLEPAISEVISESESEKMPISENSTEELVSEEKSENEKIETFVYYYYPDDMLPYFEEIDSAIMGVFRTTHLENGFVFLYNGACYTIEENFNMTIKGPKPISNITTTVEYVHIVDYEWEGIHEWDISVETTGTNIEVPLTITYEDGTTEDLVVYLTKDWKYAWEK